MPRCISVALAYIVSSVAGAAATSEREFGALPRVGDELILGAR